MEKNNNYIYLLGFILALGDHSAQTVPLVSLK